MSASPVRAEEIARADLQTAESPQPLSRYSPQKAPSLLKHDERRYWQTEAQDQFSKLLAHAVEAIICTTAQGRIRLFSRGAEKLLGYSAANMIGRPIQMLLPRHELRRLRLLMRREREGVQDFETIVTHQNRKNVPVRLSISCVPHQNGKPEAFLAILHELSSWRAAEQQLRQRSDELENYVHLVTHSLKTPIVSMQGFANLLREELGPQLGEEHAHFLERILHNAGVMENLIVDLFEFSRFGRSAAKLEWCDARELISNVLNDLRVYEWAAAGHGEKTIPPGKIEQAEIILPPRLPHLLADPPALRAVFENLLSNALKYRRPEARLRVEIGWQEQPRFHVFWVSDNGMGMPAEFQAKAFELFQRGPHVHHIAGTGAGLAIVRRIVENHHGMIRLESTPGQGTTVYFTLPKLELRGEDISALAA